MKLTDQVREYVHAAFTGLWVQTHEPDEAEGILRGQQAQLARVLGVSHATVCRDLKALGVATCSLKGLGLRKPRTAHEKSPRLMTGGNSSGIPPAGH